MQGLLLERRLLEEYALMGMSLSWVMHEVEALLSCHVLLIQERMWSWLSRLNVRLLLCWDLLLERKIWRSMMSSSLPLMTWSAKI